MNAQTTIRRKLMGAEEANAARERMLLKALRQAVARTAEDACDLALSVIAGQQDSATQDELADRLTDDHLLILLDRPDGGIGAATLSLELVCALIQQQTMGSVSPQTAPDRDYTPTDAAMCAPLIEGVFARAATQLAEASDGPLFDSWRFGAMVEDTRALLLLFEAELFRHIRLTVDIALGRHQGQLSLILPEAPVGQGDACTGADGTDEQDNPLMNVSAELTAVLCKLRVPLSQLTRMRPGDTLPLPADKLKETLLTGMSGRTVSTVILGQMNGHRAVKLVASARRRNAPRSEPGAGFEPAAPWQDESDIPGPSLDALPEVSEMAGQPEQDDDWPSADLPDLPPMTMEDDNDTDPGHPDDEGTDPEMAVEARSQEISELAGLDFGVNLDDEPPEDEQ